MMLGLADSAIAGYLAWGVLKGRRRGLSVELPRLASALMAFLTGAGWSHWIARAVAEMNELAGKMTAAIGWGGCLMGSRYVVPWFRAQAGQWISQRYPTQALQNHGGMMAGFARTLFLSSMTVMLLLHTPLAFFVRDSVLGRGLVKIMPSIHHTARPQSN
jgi:uncharacterized membrane protein required for colicin V production